MTANYTDDEIMELSITSLPVVTPDQLASASTDDEQSFSHRRPAGDSWRQKYGEMMARVSLYGTMTSIQC